MICYVAGLLFDEGRTRVALIHKDHGPEHLIGKWNAIGGRCKEDEIYLPTKAMTREFLEETGVSVSGWEQFLWLEGENDGQSWRVTFFRMFNGSALDCVHTREMEEVRIFPVSCRAVLTSLTLTDNLAWIVAMALSPELHKFYVKEIV